MNIEACILAQLLTIAQVTAIVGSGSAARIRPYKLWTRDEVATGACLLLRANREEPENDLSARGGAATVDFSVVSVAQTLAAARALDAAVRFGGTGAGAGLAGTEFTAAGIEVQSCMLMHVDWDFAWFADGSDEGFYYGDAHYQLAVTEAVF